MSNVQSSFEVYDAIQCTSERYFPCPDLLADEKEYFFIKCIEFYPDADSARLGHDGILIDLSSHEAAVKAIHIDTERFEGLFLKYNAEGLFGNSEFDTNERALSMKRSLSEGPRANLGSRVKFSLRMKNKYILKPDYSYIVVTYRTNITSKYGTVALMLENYREENIVLAPDISVSNGRYVRSEPINIHVVKHPSQDFFRRLCNQYSPDDLFTNADLIYISTNESSGVHNHPHFEIMYCTEGNANVTVHSAVYEISKGDMIIIPPLCAHNVCSGVAASSFETVRFNPEYFYTYGVPFPTIRSRLYTLQENLRSSPLIPSNEVRALGLDSLTGELYRLTEKNSFGSYVRIHTMLLSLFSVLLERFGKEKTEALSPTVSTAAFDRAIAKAQENMYSFTTAEAAKVSGLSYNYFCTGFKKAYGMSFAAYMYSLRLSESTRLLLTTDMSITEIAAAIGFADTCHYIRKFKQAYSITPNKYRTKAKKQS